MHFINAYLLEPNIAGKMIGLHPALLIASLFVFSGLFGFLGLLIAVPLTATLVMFFNDWLKSNVNISLLKE
jgi:predicted PurR-regulated permease PerM